MSKNITLTTSIPYVNGNPHIGHAFEYVQAQVMASTLKRSGYDVIFTAGTDENALKNVESAEKAGQTVEAFVDGKVNVFKDLLKAYNITPDVFVRTSSPTHFAACQKLWAASREYIYKKSYTGLYCVGCETFYQDGEFPGNVCPNHNRALESVTEENYFFSLSKFQKQIEELLEKDILKITPAYRKVELLNFVKKGLEDFSISRPTTRLKGWGVPVPGDDSQRMYVWYDALTNYITALGYGRADESQFVSHWQEAAARIHVVGKDIIKFHGIYWPAMLMAAGLKPPTHLVTHGFITVNGQKMSKTLGNVVDPFELVAKFGLDVATYFFAREIPMSDDGDYSETRLVQLKTAELSNELGNLVSRTCALAAADGLVVGLPAEVGEGDISHPEVTRDLAQQTLEELLQYHSPITQALESLRAINKSFNEFAPWTKVAGDRAEFLQLQIANIKAATQKLQFALPTAAPKIMAALTGQIAKIAPLFPR